MPKMNLLEVVVVDDKDGNPQGFGPGEADVPDYAIKALQARGDDLERLKAPDPKKAASTASKAAEPSA